MIYRIAKSYSFDASHQLHGLPEGHKCGRLHGHTYTVTIELESIHAHGIGFVVDFGNLAPLKKHIDSSFDHRHLNDVVMKEPTSENLAEYFWLWCQEHREDLGIVGGISIRSIRVSETPTSWAEYRLGSGA